MVSSTLHPLSSLNLILVARHVAFALKSSFSHDHHATYTSESSYYSLFRSGFCVSSCYSIVALEVKIIVQIVASFYGNASPLKLKLVSCHIHVAGGNAHSCSKWYSERAKIVQEEPISEKGCSYILIIRCED